MMTKQMRIRLSNEAYEYLQELQENRNIDSESKTINEIILEHKHQNMIEGKTDYNTSMMMAEMNRKLEQELNKHFKRLQLGVNNTDRNSQMLLELMNGFMIHNDVSHIMTTSDYESPTLVTAKEEVNERIANLQQRKAEYEKKKNHTQGG
jgi:phosphopantetheine adenylyltransferase